MKKNVLAILGPEEGVWRAPEMVAALLREGFDVRTALCPGAEDHLVPSVLERLTGHRALYALGALEGSAGNWGSTLEWADIALLWGFDGSFGPSSVSTALLFMLNTRAVPSVVVLESAHQTGGALQPTASGLSLSAEILVAEGAGLDHALAPARVVEAVQRALEPKILQGLRVLVTAGPTREPMDPARFVSNASSGKMGYALARMARHMGAEVTLVTGPVTLVPPEGVEVVAVETAVQMFDAVMVRAAQMDIVVKAAAVSDWRPAEVAEQKVTKQAIAPTLAMARNPDILAELGRRFGPETASEKPLLVAFAAESHDVVARGLAKMRRKGAHMLVANQIGGPDSAFGADQSVVHVLGHDPYQTFGPAPKQALARHILERALAAYHLLTRPG